MMCALGCGGGGQLEPCVSAQRARGNVPDMQSVCRLWVQHQRKLDQGELRVLSRSVGGYSHDATVRVRLTRRCCPSAVQATANAMVSAGLRCAELVAHTHAHTHS